jgi:hypothetical protein
MENRSRTSYFSSGYTSWSIRWNPVSSEVAWLQGKYRHICIQLGIQSAGAGIATLNVVGKDAAMALESRRNMSDREFQNLIKKQFNL